MGKKKKQHKECVSAANLNILLAGKANTALLNNSRSRATKTSSREQYLEENRAVTKNKKTEKEYFVDCFVKEADYVAAQGNMKQLHDTTRKLSGKYMQTGRPTEDWSGDQMKPRNTKQGRDQESHLSLGLRFACKVIHEGQPTDSFIMGVVAVEPSVTFPLLIAVDWVMRKTG